MDGQVAFSCPTTGAKTGCGAGVLLIEGIQLDGCCQVRRALAGRLSRRLVYELICHHRRDDL